MKIFKDSVTKFNVHAQAQAHMECAHRAAQFLTVYKNLERNIAAHIGRVDAALISQNREKLTSIVKTVVFLGKNGLPLRGHRDDGAIDPVKEAPDGLFRNLVRFRVDSGDEKLRSLLDDAPGNARYVSKTTQNDIIKAIGASILQGIVQPFKEAQFFSVMVDETSDIGRIQQATVVIRFVESSGAICEEFLGFVEADDMTGKGLAQLIITFLGQVGLSLDQCRGQGYDGAASMRGRINGCQAQILALQPLALYTHCFNHRLNLVLLRACKSHRITNAFGVISRVSDFFLSSPKRVKALSDVIDQSEEAGEHKKRRLRTLCPTRWVDGHDSVIVFQELLPHVAVSLESQKDAGCHDAIPLLASIREPTFIVSVVVVATVMSQSVSVSKALQMPGIDLGSAYRRIKALRTWLEEMRSNADERFKSLFLTAHDLANTLGVEELTIPRRVGRQVHRNNAPASTPDAESHYRINVFIPFIEDVIQQLGERFEHDVPIQLALQQLLPAFSQPESLDSIMEVAELYEGDLDNPLPVVRAEVESWLRLVAGRKENDVPSSVKLAMDALLPAVAALLRIYGTIPISNATAERSFSKLKLLKTYLRSTMGQERLTGLAILFVHREMEIDVPDVLNRFKSMGNRRILL